MRVRVLFFGLLKDVAGQNSDSVTLPDGATVAELLANYEQQFPRLKQYRSSLAVSLNQEYASSDAALRDGDEVGLLPPVSGGGGSSSAPATHAEITRTSIQTSALLTRIKAPADGAVVVFEGIVRDNSRGRRTLYLDYEAYEPMALKKLEALAARALSEFRVRDVAIVHRLGRLEIGEISVAIAVSSAHRDAAFDACRWLIDTLKTTIPIWKKEYFADGAVWADGERFPPEIALPRNLGPETESK